MSRQWVIPIPSLTYRDPLSLNDRRHWRERHRVTQLIKYDVGILAKRKIPGGRLDRITVGLLWEPRTRRRRDGDNLAPTIKAAVDGLVVVGIIADDDTTRVTHAPIRITEPTGEPSRFSLVITENEEVEAKERQIVTANGDDHGA